MELTADRLRELLHYDPDTGVFIWRKAHCDKVVAGRIAGCVTDYRRIRIDGKLFLASRLAWFHTTGAWPVSYIDHINGVRNDDRWANLRLATMSENLRNRPKNINNKSGFKGVCLHKGRWQARIKLNYINHFLGYFDTPQEAHAAYCVAAECLHGEFARTT